MKFLVDAELLRLLEGNLQKIAEIFARSDYAELTSHALIERR